MYNLPILYVALWENVYDGKGALGYRMVLDDNVL